MVSDRPEIFIYPWATDTAGCFYQRLKLPLEALTARYPEEFRVCWNCEPKPGADGVRSVVLGQRIPGNGDFSDPRWQQFCDDPGVFTVYEIDDDIFDLDPENVVPYNIFTPNRAGSVANLRAADHVIAATPNLVAKVKELRADPPSIGANDAVTLGVNCIADGSVRLRDRVKDEGEPIVIGWAGSMFHRQDFLPEYVGQLAAVRDAFGPSVAWVTIGADYLGWGSHFGWSDIDSYHRRLDMLDIGIAPLALTPFNASKSWIKGLDYMAAGVVPVLQRWGNYPDLFVDGDGAGFYVDDEPDSWYDTLCEAVVAYQHGLPLGALAERAGRFEISKQVDTWADVFRLAAS